MSVPLDISRTGALVCLVSLLFLVSSCGPSPEEKIAQLVGETSVIPGDERLEEEIVAMGDDAVVPLFNQAIRADQPSIEDISKRKFIADLLKLLPPDKVKSVLKERLSSEITEERITCLVLLSAGVHVDAFETEVGALISDPDPSIRRAAILTSRKLPAKGFEGEYEEGIRSSDPVVRLYSASGLVEAGSEMGYSTLEGMLRQSDLQMVISAMDELSGIGTTRARAILLAYRKEAPQNLRPMVDSRLQNWTRRDPINAE